MRIKNLILVFGLLFILCGCGKPPFMVSDNDIVFQMLEPEWTSDKGEEYPNYVGFVNLDGSDLTTFKVEERWLQPTASRDGLSFFYHTGWTNPIAVSENWGTVSGWDEKPIDCPINKMSTAWFVSPMSEGRMILSVADEIRLVKIDQCQEIDRLVDHASADKNKYLIDGFSLSRDEKFIVYSERMFGEIDTYTIWLLNIETREAQKTAAVGINPSLSPDNRYIAYLSKNGIEILDLQTNRSTLINPYRSTYFDREGSRFDNQVPPAPQWSADGQWLLYHKCIKEFCPMLSDYGIYKMQVSTHEETLVFQGGMYPYWIK